MHERVIDLLYEDNDKDGKSLLHNYAIERTGEGSLSLSFTLSTERVSSSDVWEEEAERKKRKKPPRGGGQSTKEHRQSDSSTEHQHEQIDVVLQPRLADFHDSFVGGGMNGAEQELLARTYASAKSVFEWGMGSSTLIAAHVGIERLTAVDSAPTWVDKVHTLIDSSRPQYTLQHADIGPVKGYGYPIDDMYQSRWPDYSLQVNRESESFDVYLVDGRFRVACACQALLHGRADSLVLVHDFGRDVYHVLLTLADRVEQERELVVLRRKAIISDNDIEALWEMYKLNSV